MNAITTVGGNGGGLIPHDMQSAMRLAEMMASSKLLPTHFHGKPGDCFLVIEQASRWNMSPFAVAACTSVVQGKLMYEGKLVAAAVQTAGVLEGRLDYEFSGAGEKRTVKVTGKIRGEAKVREVDVIYADAKTTNQWWAKTPDQMLSYYGARAWSRRHTPEVMLGVYSPEEFDQPVDNFRGVTLDSVAEPAPAPVAPSAPDHVAIIQARLDQCDDNACVVRVSEAWKRAVGKAETAGKPIATGTLDAVQDLLADYYGRFQPEPVAELADDADEMMGE